MSQQFQSILYEKYHWKSDITDGTHKTALFMLDVCIFMFYTQNIYEKNENSVLIYAAKHALNRYVLVYSLSLLLKWIKCMYG